MLSSVFKEWSCYSRYMESYYTDCWCEGNFLSLLTIIINITQDSLTQDIFKYMQD